MSTVALINRFHDGRTSIAHKDHEADDTECVELPADLLGRNAACGIHFMSPVHLQPRLVDADSLSSKLVRRRDYGGSCSSVRCCVAVDHIFMC